MHFSRMNLRSIVRRGPLLSNHHSAAACAARAAGANNELKKGSLMHQVRKAVSAMLRSARVCPPMVLGGVLFASFGANTALAAEEEEISEVIVTGSRIQQRQDYIAPNPIVSVTGED